MYERIRDHLESNGIVYKHVAVKSRIERQRFYRIMRGNAPLLVDEYETICRDGLGIDPGYFFKQNVLDSKQTS